MADILWGVVDTALDGETVEVLITRAHPDNAASYLHREFVRIETLTGPEPICPPGFSARMKLLRRLKGATVRLEVRSRDPDGRLVCGVFPGHSE